MRFLLKILSLPVVATLSILVMLLSFLVACVGAALKLASFLGFLLGAGIAIVTDPVAGGLILLGAFLISHSGCRCWQTGCWIGWPISTSRSGISL